jgi:predicted Fe-Mo cluster-binding NifX family protein
MIKIAFATDDHLTISAHFGRASFYEVFTVENGIVIQKEARPKANHSQFAEQGLHDHRPGKEHGANPASQHRHGAMMDTIADCQVLLACGMGMGAHDALVSRGIQPILTDIQEIEQAVKAYIDGQLVDHPEWLH